MSAPVRRLGHVLTKALVVAGAWLIAVSMICAALAALGWWSPWVGLPCAVVVLFALVKFLPDIPGPTISPIVGVGLVLIAVAASVWLGLTPDRQIVPRRDAGSNLQATIALATTHHRVIAVDPAVLGGAEVLRKPGVALSSPAFYQIGSPEHPSIQPQFVIGPAAVFSLAYWVGGLAFVWWISPLLTGLICIGMGLLTARWLCGGWPLLVCAMTALAFPIFHTGRATYSEPLSTVTLLAAMLAMVGASQRDSRPDELPEHLDPTTQARACAFLAGALVGGTIVVRIDGLRESILCLLVAGALHLRARPWGAPMLRGLGYSTLLSALIAATLSWRYLGTIFGSLAPLIAGGILAAGAVWAAVRMRARGVSLPGWVTRRLIPWSAPTVIVVGLVLASRPWWLITRQSPNDPGSRFVGRVQTSLGLTLDAGRTYAENSLIWLSWWVGPLALALALAALAVLWRRLAAAWVGGSPWPSWFGPVFLGTGATALTLLRPSITPDHPWADRRLVIAAPFVIALAVVALAWLTNALSRRHGSTLAAMGATAGAAILLITPTAQAWQHRSDLANRSSAQMVAGLCRSIEPRDVIITVDARSENEWPQVVRGMCGRPVLVAKRKLRDQPRLFRETLTDIAQRVAAHGGRLRLLASEPEDDGGEFVDDPRNDDDPIAVLRARDSQMVIDVTDDEDGRTLVTKPDRLRRVSFRVWLATVPTANQG